MIVHRADSGRPHAKWNSTDDVPLAHGRTDRLLASGNWIYPVLTRFPQPNGIDNGWRKPPFHEL
jgi:hypothetical protein